MNRLEDNRRGILVVSLLLLLAAISRLLPHPDNFTPLGAIALFGGTFIANRRLAILIPLGLMLFSDIMLEVVFGTGFHNTMFYVYGALILVSTIGFVLRSRVQLQTILVSSLVGSLIFFFITNFGMWMTGYYGYSGKSLLDCYIAGIPFFRGTVTGDLFFNLVLFGSFSLVRRRFPSMAK